MVAAPNEPLDGESQNIGGVARWPSHNFLWRSGIPLSGAEASSLAGVADLEA